MENVGESRPCFPVEACSSRTTSDVSDTNFGYGTVLPNSPIDSEMGALITESPKNGQFQTTEDVLERLGSLIFIETLMKTISFRMEKLQINLYCIVNGFDLGISCNADNVLGIYC